MTTLALISGLLNILLGLWLWSLIREIICYRRIIRYQRDVLSKGVGA